MLGLEGKDVHMSEEGWVPVYLDARGPNSGEGGVLACMSIGFLLKSSRESVVWRGPKKNAMIKQFLAQVRWGELDYLIVDTPPGASWIPRSEDAIADSRSQARPTNTSPSSRTSALSSSPDPPIPSSRRSPPSLSQPHKPSPSSTSRKSSPLSGEPNSPSSA